MVMLLALVLPTALPISADNDEQRKVVIACDWDFAPYEFNNNEGETTGFNVEVIKTILDGLYVPYEFSMGTRRKAVEDFLNHEADLIIDYSNRFTGDAYCRSLSILEYSNIVVAYNKMTPPINKVSQLQGRIIAVNGVNDSILRSPLQAKLPGAIFTFQSAREALAGLESGQLNYFVWGKELLQWKLKEYDLHNVVLGELDLPANEIHVVGYDRELMEDIDNQFARLQQSGQIDLMRDKWFHPERETSRTSPMVKYFIIAVLMLSILVFAIYRITRIRVKKAVQRNKVTEAMMLQALSIGKLSVITNNLRNDKVTNLHGHALPEEGLTSRQLMGRVHPDDREDMMSRPKIMDGKKGQPLPFKMRWNTGTEENPKWANTIGYSYAEMKHGHPENIVIVTRDVTDQVQKEQRDHELTERYMKMFDSTLIAMSFYDKEGHLVNLNKNMKKLCGLTEQSLKFFWNTNFFEIDLIRGDYDPQSTEDMHFCQRMCYPEIGIDKYIELRIHPIVDKKGSLMYYVITARDVTDERVMYLELQKQQKALGKATETNIRYEKELHDLLENCNMYVWHADPKTGVISFARSLHSDKELTETFEEYLSGMDESHRQDAIENIQHIPEFKEPFNVVHRFNHTPVTDVPTWFAVSGMPIFDDDGHVKSLFGLVRDITRLMEAQERLKEETARAENSAILKSTFLANMTHEIRTPLNAIVGFSDLLQSVETPEERKEFIRIIRNNCDMLLRLINDIFEASTMDVKPLSIVPLEVNFSVEYDIVCHSLAQRVQKPDVQFIADNPYDSLIVTIDMGRMQQVITNFVTNAIKYTDKGHIRVGYCIKTEDKLPLTSAHSPLTPREGLYIFCEDTGAGIPKDKQARVFDRFVKLNDFVQGTGLGLAISKSIAMRCDGHIGLISEGEGKGSTFWIWVPCQCIEKN